jgi:hypothetical protein
LTQKRAEDLHKDGLSEDRIVLHRKQNFADPNSVTKELCWFEIQALVLS